MYLSEEERTYEKATGLELEVRNPAGAGHQQGRCVQAENDHQAGRGVFHFLTVCRLPEVQHRGTIPWSTSLEWWERFHPY